MKKVFYVESDQLMRIALERLLKDSTWEIYTLESMDDFDFRCKDFAPDLLLLDLTLFKDAPLERTDETPIVYVGFNDVISETPWINEEYHTIEKPLDAMKIESILNLELEKSK